MEKIVGPASICRRLHLKFDGMPDGPNTVAAGIFKPTTDDIDDILPLLMQEALNLSIAYKFKNIFTGPKAGDRAFSFIRDSAATESQPHAVLIPRGMPTSVMLKFLGSRNFDEKLLRYRKTCAVVSCDVPAVIFCSRPDFVGLLTRFHDKSVGFVLHNVKHGLAFCSLDELCISSTDSLNGRITPLATVQTPRPISTVVEPQKNNASDIALDISPEHLRSIRQNAKNTTRRAVIGTKKAAGVMHAASHPGPRRGKVKAVKGRKLAKPVKGS
jgi:hypothetical protein